LIEIGLLVLEKKILNLKKTFSVLLLLCYYLPLGKGVPLHLNNLKFPPIKIIYTKSGLIGPVVLEKKSKMSKFTDGQKDKQTTDKGPSGEL
jgi:hypothetical protein